MRKYWIHGLILFALLGCDEGKPTAPTGSPGALVGNVVDASGTPIEGAAIGLVFRMDLVGAVAKRAFAGTAVFLFSLTDSATAELTILDLHDQCVRAIGPLHFGPGEHQFSWDGLDDRGTPVPNGFYIADLMLSGTGIAENQRAGFLFQSIDPMEMVRSPQTTTDADGQFQVSLTDLPLERRTSFIDENGMTGAMSVSRAVEVYAVIPGTVPLRYRNQAVVLPDGSRTDASFVIPSP